MTALRVKDLSVEIGGVSVVREVSFTVESGMWLGVIGPNGAGKSTLLRALVGAVGSRGLMEFAGWSARDHLARDRARRVAMVAQTPLVPDGARVVDYVLLGRTPYIGRFRTESAADLEVAEAVLRDLGLVAFANRRLDSLSGGERQRVFIARALAQETPILLLDEPTSALDVGHQQEVLELVDHLRRERGLAVVSALHDLTVASRYPDELMLMVGGEVVAHGDAVEVLTEEHLERFYGAQVRILCDEDGITVVPRRTRR
ncbi:MAG: ABC transporter ATP-binding protein [Acidimicrobiia bacterium]